VNKRYRLAHPVVLALPILALLLSVSWAAPAFPPLSGRVVDEAHVLGPSARAKLDASLADLESKTSRQLVVVTLPSLQGYDIADYGYQLGRAWGIGQKSLNNGVLFIIAPNERKVRIEVGYGLEGVITDALSSVILQERVLPKFRAGNIEGGIVDGAQALIQQLSLDPSAAETAIAEAEQRRSAPDHDTFPSFLFALIAFWIVMRMLSGSRMGIGAALPWIILGGGRGRSGGGGGGGFSGGGGSFGGGGASGSW
jgi:uncharacterized protein